MGAVGTITGFSIHAYYQDKANAVQQSIEQAERVDEADLTEEEKTKLQILLDELTDKYNEIKNLQVAGTTVGAIAGAVVGAVVSMIPALLNRNNIKKAIEEVNLTRNLVDESREIAKQVKEQFNIVNENYEKAIEEMNCLSQNLSKAQELLEKVSDENAIIKAENAELKDILLNIVNHTKELVANGVANEVNKKYLKI